MKRLLSLAVAALLVGASAFLPQRVGPLGESPADIAPAPFAVCPASRVAPTDTRVSLIGSGAATEALTVFSAGETVASGEFAIPDSGAASMVVSDLAGIASAPLLVGLTDPTAAVEATFVGEGQSAVFACSAGTAETVTLVGGATREGDALTVTLANPFAQSASVTIGAASEVGVESEASLESILVPARSTVTLDLTTILPGRVSLAFALTTTEGRIVATAIQRSGAATAAWTATSPASDGYVVVPELGGTTKTLVMMAPGAEDVPYQLDVYTSDGLVEAAQEGTIPARSQIAIPVADLIGEGVGAIRVVAAAPVTAALSVTSETTRAVVHAATEPDGSWLLPAAGTFGAVTVHVFNPGVETAAVAITAGSGADGQQQDVAGQTMASFDLPASDSGYRVNADGAVVVVWQAEDDPGVVIAPGHALGQ